MHQDRGADGARGGGAFDLKDVLRAGQGAAAAGCQCNASTELRRVKEEGETKLKAAF